MISQQFKYQSQIDKLLSLGYKLPPLIAPEDKDACRFASSLPDAQNHVPQYMSNPKRMLHDMSANKATTSLLALSCFESETKATKFYSALQKSNPRAVKSIGDSLAEGVITDDDGRITEPTANGHFDLYEYVQCDLNKTFKIICKL